MSGALDSDNVVVTVLGEIPSSELGYTLMHEHIWADFSYYWSPSVGQDPDVSLTIENLGRLRRNPGLSKSNCQLLDLDLAIEEVAAFGAYGGRTIVELTLPDIGRDVVALATVARRTGLNVVAGCGYYVFPTHPASLAQEPVEEITARLVAELLDGIDGTGVRAGIIGEVGTSDPVHPTEEKVLRAACGAQRVTGAAISVHLHAPSRNGHDVLDILEDAGADLGRVVLGHCDLCLGHVDVGFDALVDYHRSLAERGVLIEYDTIGNDFYWPDIRGVAMSFPTDRERARAIAALVEWGYEDRILLSQDIASKIQLTRYGGYGYGSVLRDFPNFLRAFGVDEGMLATFMVDNPRRVLTVQRSHPE